MRFIEKQQRVKEHLTTNYSAIVVDYGNDIFFYKIEETGEYVVEIGPLNDFRVFDFKCNWATWEDFLDEQVLEGEEHNYTIIEEFSKYGEFEIEIERVE